VNSIFYNNQLCVEKADFLNFIMVGKRSGFYLPGMRKATAQAK